jgi:hypothetical protein
MFISCPKFITYSLYLVQREAYNIFFLFKIAKIKAIIFFFMINKIFFFMYKISYICYKKKFFFFF